MELLYIWIENYKIIQNQGFNFSPRWRFEYQHEDNELIIEDRRSEHISNFFGKDISNITAIVGKNGVGKSQLLHEIGMGLTGGNSYSGMLNNIIIIEKREEKKIEIITNKSLKYNPSYPDYDIKNVSSEKIDFQAYSLLYSHNFDFTNSSETKKTGMSFTSISSVKLFTRYQKIVNEQFRFGGLDRVNGLTFPDVYETIYKFDVNSQMAFWLKNRDFIESYGFLPEKILISGLMDTFPFSDELLSKIMNNTKEKFLAWFLACILRSLRNHLSVDYPSFIKNTHSVDLLEQKIILICKELKNSKECKAIIELISIVKDYIKDEIFYFEGGIGRTIINIEKHFNEFKVFFEICQRTTFFTTTPTKNYEDFYLNVYWEHQFSTGEQFLLSFLSRMNYQKREIKENNIVLLLDEVETGFHPDWQKKYVKILSGLRVA